MQIARSIAAVALALAALVTAGAPAALAAPVPLTEGSADWGFKQSFRSYAGGGTLTGGATVNQDGTYRFQLASGTRDAEAGTFDGPVQRQRALPLALRSPTPARST